EVRGKGMKGAVGSSASYARALKDSEMTPAEMDALVMEQLGLEAFPIATQVYPRKQNVRVMHALAELAASLYRMAFDIRILQSPPIGEWSELAPEPIAARVYDATAAMAARMAGWADEGWHVCTEADLDRYTFGVAGAVGLLLSDIWAWFDGTRTDRARAVGFGRGLQAVNILRNRADDLQRGADFFPDDWTEEAMFGYARRNLELAAAYIRDLPEGPVRAFCTLPHALADATLDALASGRPKLSREQVLQLAGR
ncbi:MAG: squalene/phytoene synthase family protein, partial [Deinococcales bacterium]